MSRKVINIPVLLLLMIVIFSMFVNELYIFFFFPLILLMIIRKIKKRQSIEFGRADMMILLFCAVDLVGLFFTEYLPNTIKVSSIIFGGAIIWFTMRFYIRDQRSMNVLIASLSSILGLMAIFTILLYFKHKTQYTSIGMSDMTMVKHLFRPFGFALNEWAAVLICSLPFPYYMALSSRRRKPLLILHLLCFVFLNIAILLSFSRSAYLSLMVFYFTGILITFLFDRTKIKFALLFFSLSLIISLIVILPEKQSVLQTSSLDGNTSQKRSTVGRTKKWSEAISLFKHSYVTGMGSGNYEIASRLYGLRKYNTMSYRSTNTVLQILVEKGLVGIVVYMLIFVMMCICVYKSIRLNPIFIPFIASLAALCLREVFFNSFFDNKVFVLFIIIFFVINYPVSLHEI